MKKILRIIFGEILMYIGAAITLWRYDLLTWESEGNSLTYDLIVGDFKEAFRIMLPTLGIVVGVTIIGALVLALFRTRRRPEVQYDDEEDE